jgi:hypothetical protein
MSSVLILSCSPMKSRKKMPEVTQMATSGKNHRFGYAATADAFLEAIILATK